MSDNEARARELANQIAERFGLVDSVCAKNGRIGACEKAAFGDCDCPKAMYPDDEKIVSDFIIAALQATESRGRAAGLREAAVIAGTMAERPYDNEPEFSAVLAVEAAIDARLTALGADTRGNGTR